MNAQLDRLRQRLAAGERRIGWKIARDVPPGAEHAIHSASWS